MTDTASPRRGRPPARTDEELLDAALASFARDGYEGVSLRSLNRELGASPAMLAKRFGDKERLWRAAVDHAIQRHRKSVLTEASTFPPDTEALEVISGLVTAFVRGAALVPDLHRVIAQEGDRDTPRLRYLVEHGVRPLFAEFVRPVLEPLVAAGTIRPVSDREVFFLVANGAAAVTALTGLSTAFDETDGTLDLDEYARSVSGLLVMGLRRERSEP